MTMTRTADPAPAAARAAHVADSAEPTDAGFMALELVIAFTLIVILVLTVVAFGRVGRARSLTEQAAADAARAASQATTPAQAHQDASTAATDTLSSGGVSCASMTLNLDTSQFHAGGQVVARLSCTASLADLAVTGAPGSITLQAQSASPVDAFRRTAP